MSVRIPTSRPLTIQSPVSPRAARARSKLTGRSTKVSRESRAEKSAAGTIYRRAVVPAITILPALTKISLLQGQLPSPGAISTIASGPPPAPCDGSSYQRGEGIFFLRHPPRILLPTPVFAAASASSVWLAALSNWRVEHTDLDGLRRPGFSGDAYYLATNW